MKDLHGKDGRKKGGERKKQMDGATLPKKPCNLLTEMCLHKYNTLCS